MGTITTELLDRSFTVEALMTPRNTLYTCKIDDDFKSIREEADKQGFDCVPVAENGKIVSVLPKGSMQPEPLTGKWLISRDTPISHLLDLFVINDQQPVLVLHRQDIVGIVTPADLNTMPMRIYIYNVIGGLEMQLATLIREHFDGRHDEILSLVRNKHAAEARDSLKKATNKNIQSDVIEYLYFIDLLDVIKQTEDLWELLDLTSDHFKEGGLLYSLNKLRRRTMHTVKPLVLGYRGKDGLVQVRERVQFALGLIEQL